MFRKIQSADYEFQVIGIDDFELKVIFKPLGSTMAMVINQAYKAVKLKTGKRAPTGKIEELLDKQILPKQYNNLIHTMIKPVLKDIYKQINNDGFIIIREQAEQVLYFKKENQWFIEIILKGIYHKN